MIQELENEFTWSLFREVTTTRRIQELKKLISILLTKEVNNMRIPEIKKGILSFPATVVNKITEEKFKKKTIRFLALCIILLIIVPPFFFSSSAAHSAKCKWSVSESLKE